MKIVVDSNIVFSALLNPNNYQKNLFLFLFLRKLIGYVRI